MAGGHHAGALRGGAGLPRLPPGAPRREAGRGALPRPRPVLLPGPRPVGRPGRPTRPQPLPHVDRDATRRRRRHRRPEVLADRTARDVRGCGQALVGALLRRLPGPGHRTGPGGPRRRARRRGRPCRRRGLRRRRWPVPRRGPPRRGAGHRWLRVGRRARPLVPPRPDDQPGHHPDQHRRRAADGHASRSRAGQHARGVVDPDHPHPRRRAVRPAAGPPDPPGAHPPPLDHGQPSGPALHQRGRQLQRPRRGLPPVRPVAVHVRQPAVLAGVRPRVPPPLRVRRSGGPAPCPTT